MKISINTTNIQSIRNTLEKSDVKKYLESKNNDSRILVWNFWYIVSPNNKEIKVRKYYIRKEYFLKELENYDLMKSLWITIPNILWSWEETIENEELYFIDFENIRLYRGGFSSILEISPKYLWNTLWLIHKANFTSGKSYIHWNLHCSNFFEAKDWEFWIFDFASMHYDDIEYDFATIYLNSNYDDNFLEEILENYSLKDKFSYKKMLVHTILKLKENINWNIYIDENKKKSLKLDLIKIKEKLWSLT